MDHSNLSRGALSICAAAALLAGCGVLRQAQDDMQPPVAPDSIPVVSGTLPMGHADSSKYRVLYRFGISRVGHNGSYPMDPVLYFNGMFYGTTYAGGFSLKCRSCMYGVVFALSPNGSGKVLHRFIGSDGFWPYGGLTALHGNLYGTTNEAGYGAGNVFRISPSGAFRVLYDFNSSSGADASGPYRNLTAVNGTLYGTTSAGGPKGDGTVYSLCTHGKIHLLHTFTGPDGAVPLAGLLDVNGMLYGTTIAGGAYKKGTVFRISTTGEQKVLFSFDGTDGGGPTAPVIAVNGKLYGTTQYGGSSGWGTVFSITMNGKDETVLHNFSYDSGDGARPEAGLLDVDGTLYGTTARGGIGSASLCQGTCGTIFSVTMSGKETVLHQFENGYENDGSFPVANLTEVKGRLYGTTEFGGYSPNCGSYPCYRGTVFEFTP
jgi:uncharacterized repeat protein (TIGR03803 family)